MKQTDFWEETAKILFVIQRHLKKINTIAKWFCGIMRFLPIILMITLLSSICCIRWSRGDDIWYITVWCKTWKDSCTFLLHLHFIEIKINLKEWLTVISDLSNDLPTKKHLNFNIIFCLRRVEYFFILLISFHILHQAQVFSTTITKKSSGVQKPGKYYGLHTSHERQNKQGVWKRKEKYFVPCP